MFSMRNARSLWLAAAFLLVLGWQAKAFAASSGGDVYSDDDTWMRSDQTGAPGGGVPQDNDVKLGTYSGATYSARILAHFDLTQFTGLTTGSTVSAAQFKLTYWNNSNSGASPATTLRVYRVTKAWAGTGASWDQATGSLDKWTALGGDFTPALGSGVLPTTAPAPDGAHSQVVWDVTSIVNDWINNGQTNAGLIVIADTDATSTDFYRFVEGPDYTNFPATASWAPTLTVTYSSTSSTTINASQDTTICSTYNNVGATRQNKLIQATDERMLLKFPLASIPNNTQVAILRVKSAGVDSSAGSDSTTSGGQAGTGVISAYKLTQSAWVEGTGTRAATTSDGARWDRYDATNNWTTNGGDYDNTRAFLSPSTTISGSDVDVTFDIDVSALVVEAQAATATDVDFILLPGGNVDWRIGSKEYAGGTPPAPRTAQLIVTSTASALPSIAVPTPTTATNGASKTFTWTYAGGAMTTFDVYLGDGTTFKKITTSPVTGTAGTGSYTWTVDTTGLTAPPASTYVLKVVEATKLFQKTSAAFTINAAASPLSITTASLPAGTQSTAYTTTTLTGTGGTAPYTWTATGLPTGLTLTTAGVLSGTPTVNGTFPVTITLTDATPTSVNTTLNIVLASAPGALTITSSVPPNPVVNVPYSFTATATGGTAPYTWSATGLPTGITINAGSGVISGTATSLGGGTWVITVTDAVPSSIATPGYTVTVVTASATGTGKKGGCELGGFNTDSSALLLLLIATGLFTVVVRRTSATA